MKLFWKFFLFLVIAPIVAFILTYVLTGCASRVDFKAYLKEQQEEATLAGFFSGYAKGLAAGVQEGWAKRGEYGDRSCSEAPGSDSLFNSVQNSTDTLEGQDIYRDNIFRGPIDK